MAVKTVTIYCNIDTDKDVLDYLASLGKGQASGFVKQLIRSYIANTSSHTIKPIPVENHINAPSIPSSPVFPLVPSSKDSNKNMEKLDKMF